MEEGLICLDTSVLIEYFRKTKKENSFLYKLSFVSTQFAVSIVTKFDILIGSNENQKEFWNTFFERVEVLDFEEQANQKAVEIHKQLKTKNQLIGFADLMIGATALAKGAKLATLNEAHFKRIDDLEIISKV